MPSLLDRLTDPESAGSSSIIGYTVEAMYHSVLSDLEDLLNSVQTLQTIPAEFPMLRDSILGYGLPDLASTPAVSPVQRATVGKTIQRAVERFEPRLKNIKVTLLDPEANLVNASLRFRIDARLRVDPAPDVAFDTVLELGSGKYIISPTTAA